MLRRGIHRVAIVAAIMAACLLVPALAPSEAVSQPDAVAGAPADASVSSQEVIVRFRSGVTAGQRDAARRAADTTFEETLPLPGLQLVDPDPGVTSRSAIADLERSGTVLYAEPDYTRIASVTPNDRHYGLLWGLHNTGQSVDSVSGVTDADVDGPEAWDLTTGSAGVTVGVIDSGVDYAHPDLSPNIWRNPGESGEGRDSNGIDDDLNGLVDDWRGWDWVQGDNDPADENGHGTHVAGTIGARGNDGVGVAGLAWQSGLLPLRVLDAEGSGRVSDLISAYAYADRQQIRVVNASLGGDGFSQAEHDAIRAAPSTLFVVAAGNDGADNDSSGSYPCNYELANIVCVAASNQSDALAGFSNYGATKVDLAAPGVNIASTWLSGRWVYLDGTSMATPHVAGAAALAWSREPTASVSSVRNALLGSVDPVASHGGRTVTGGRLNARGAVARIGTGSSTPADDLPRASQTLVPAPAASGALAPAPMAVPAIGTVADRNAPAISLKVASVLRLRRVLRTGVPVRTRCSEACTVRHELVLDRITAKRLGLGRGAKPVVVARGRGGVGRAGSSAVRVRFTARARRSMTRLRSTRLVLQVRVTDRVGNVRTARRTLRPRS